MPAYRTHYRIALFAIVVFFAIVGFYVTLDTIGILLASRVEIVIIVAIAIAGALTAAFVSRTTQPFAFFSAERILPAAPNGIVAGAQIAGFCYVGLIGMMFASGYSSLGIIVGWAGGFAISAVLVAPYLRKAGTYTVPDFLGERYDSAAHRLLATAIVVTVAGLFFVAHINALGMIAAKLTGLSPGDCVRYGTAIVALAAILGGMRSVTWFQLVLAGIAIIAFVVPATMISYERFGSLIPQITYAPLFEDIAVLKRDLILRGLADSGPTLPARSEVAGLGTPTFYALVVAITGGTVAMPYIAMRALAANSCESARLSFIWALLVMIVLTLTVPAYAIFVKTDLYQNLIGLDLTQLPNWLIGYGRAGLIEICGRAATSIGEIRAACEGAGGTAGQLRLDDLVIAPDIIFLLASEMHGFTPALIAMAGTGAIAALMIGASGALLVIGHTIGHDVFIRSLFPGATTAIRLLVTRLMVIGAAITGVIATQRYQIDTVKLVTWAFSIAGGGLFVPMMMAIWVRGSTRAAAFSAMVVGSVVTLGYIYLTEFAGVAALFGIRNLAAGAFGVIAAGAIGIAALSMTPKPHRRMLEFVDRMRTPVGETLYDERRRLRRQSQSNVPVTAPEDAEA